jgi:hypothetical protein
MKKTSNTEHRAHVGESRQSMSREQNGAASGSVTSNVEWSPAAFSIRCWAFDVRCFLA